MMHFNPNSRLNFDSEDSFTSCKMYAVKGLTTLSLMCNMLVVW